MTCCFAVLVGCFQSKQVFTVNPDGSGKVVIENTYSLKSPMNPDIPAKEAALATIDDIFSKSEFESWKDVTCEIINDEKLIFKGTAYCPDITKVDFMSLGGGESEQDDGGLTLEKQADGTLKLYNKSKKVEDKKLTDKEVDDIYKKKLKQHNTMKPMMAMMAIDSLEIEKTYRFSGTILKATVYKKNSDGSYGLLLTGKSITKAKDELISDEKAYKTIIKSDGPSGGKNVTMEKAYGGSPSLIIKNAEQIFDYKKEMEAAKAGMEAMKKKVIESLGK